MFWRNRRGLWFTASGRILLLSIVCFCIPNRIIAICGHLWTTCGCLKAKVTQGHVRYRLFRWLSAVIILNSELRIASVWLFRAQNEYQIQNQHIWLLYIWSFMCQIHSRLFEVILGHWPRMTWIVPFFSLGRVRSLLRCFDLFWR